MTLVHVSVSGLKEGRWREHAVRFGLGGAATAFAGWIASRFGPSIGGLFLALPAIFCASATLIEKHEIRRKKEAGMDGRRRGQEAAALDANGAAIGSVGLLAFAACFSLTVLSNVIVAFLSASVVWLVISVMGWWAWRRLRIMDRRQHPWRR